MSDLSDILKKTAQSLRACHKALRQWPDDGDPGSLVRLWKQNIDFAIENDFPSTDFIKSNFDRELLHANLIYVDEHIDLKNAPNGVYVLNGECSGTLWFDSWAVATVYVRHNSNVTIIADDFAKAFVRIYDEADAEVVELDEAVVKVYH